MPRRPQSFRAAYRGFPGLCRYRGCHAGSLQVHHTPVYGGPPAPQPAPRLAIRLPGSTFAANILYMTSSIKLGRIFGIEIGLHYSWFLIALLITFSLASQFGETNPQWGPGIIWATAILTALLFFAALVE